MSQYVENKNTWHPVSRFGFRFLFVFWLLYIAPWTWVSQIPFFGDVLGFLSQWHFQALQFLTEKAKDLVGIETVVDRRGNGSGDTVDNWVSYAVVLSISLIINIVWSFVDRRRKDYAVLYRYLRVLLRYKLAITLFIYGLIKLFPLQMPFPSLSQLVTPFGDYSMMRLSWLFIGASPAYQVISGVLEVLAGILLLFRRTTLAGTLLSTVLFANIVLLNYAYDIVVKLYSANLLLMAFFLLAHHYHTLIDFFFHQQKGAFVTLPPSLRKRGYYMAAVAIKVLVIVVFLLVPLVNNYQRYHDGQYKYSISNDRGILTGIFDVEQFVLNGDTIPIAPSDSIRWHNLVFEEWAGGSIGYGLKDLPKLRYGRDYFDYLPDTLARRIQVKYKKDTIRNSAFEYTLLDDGRVRLREVDNDSTSILLRRNPNQPYIISDKRFNWISNFTR